MTAYEIISTVISIAMLVIAFSVLILEIVKFKR